MTAKCCGRYRRVAIPTKKNVRIIIVPAKFLFDDKIAE